MKKTRSTVCGVAFLGAFAGGILHDINPSQGQMAMRVIPRYGMELACEDYGHTRRPGRCQNWRELYEDWGGKVYPKPGCRSINPDDCEQYYGLEDPYFGMDDYYYD